MRIELIGLQKEWSQIGRVILIFLHALHASLRSLPFPISQSPTPIALCSPSPYLSFNETCSLDMVHYIRRGPPTQQNMQSVLSLTSIATTLYLLSFVVGRSSVSHSGD